MKFICSLFIALGAFGCSATTDDVGSTEEAVEAGDARLFWTEADSVRSSNLDGTDAKTIVAGKLPIGVAFDRETGAIVWSDRGTHELVRTALDGTKLGLIGRYPDAQLGAVAIDGLSLFWAKGMGLASRYNGGPSFGYSIAYRVTGIAVDRRKHKVYWSDRALDAIVRGNYDGTGVEIVYEPNPFPEPGTSEDEGVNPSAVAVDSVNRRLYWTERGAVKSADLDCEDVSTLADTPNPTGIAVDPKTQKVYFTDSTTDTVTRIDADGSSREIIYRAAADADPRQITVGR